jgi:hypothetical protein
MILRDLREIFRVRKAAIKDELSKALTQIHISFDLWTSPNRLAFLSTFGHFIDQNQQPQSRLLGFRCQQGQHSGQNIALTVEEVVQGWDISHKLGVDVSDNAISNDTYIQALYSSLDPFITLMEVKACRIRCFGHILNLVAQAFLYGEDGASFEQESDIYGIRGQYEEDLEHWRSKGPVGKLFNIVRFIKTSP